MARPAGSSASFSPSKIIFWYDNRTRGGRRKELGSISKDRGDAKNRARCEPVVSPHSLALNEMARKGNGTLMNMHVEHYLCRPCRIGLLLLLRVYRIELSQGVISSSAIGFCQVAPDAATEETMTRRTVSSASVFCVTIKRLFVIQLWVIRRCVTL